MLLGNGLDSLTNFILIAKSFYDNIASLTERCHRFPTGVTEVSIELGLKWRSRAGNNINVP